MLAGERGPLFVGDWDAPVFLHFALPAAILQPHCAFPLDLWEGEAVVSLVAFTMRRFRFARGGRLGAWACWLLREQRFLNLRTYVEVSGEPGISFLAEWISDWFQTRIGPTLYGLPYHWGRHDFWHDPHSRWWSGQVESRGAGGGKFCYEVAAASQPWASATSGSRDEFLLERHTCFLAGRSRERFFRIWHPPWPQVEAAAQIGADDLLRKFAPWWGEARLIGANVSPGVHDVWMGRPQRLRQR